MVAITVVGAGYVGLVTGAGLAELGHSVVCVDTDVAKIESLNNGQIPIFEAGLEDLVANGRAAASDGSLHFQSTHDERSFKSDVYFLCVPTPQADDGTADTSYLTQAASDIGTRLPTGATVVNKSTVPVGSTKLVEGVIKRDDVAVVSNPEFLREGSAVHDFFHPDRIVIGAVDVHHGERVQKLYDGIETEFVITDPVSSELIKYAANSFLATKLSFINAIAAVCDGVGADISDVRIGIGLDRRIGLDFFSPGPAWGGSCFPKDTNAMLAIAAGAGYDFAMVRAAIDANNEQIERVAGMVLGALDRPADQATVAVLGLAFKAGTDDTRMSPALSVASELHDAGVRLVGYDPVAQSTDFGIEQVESAMQACADADVVLIATEWAEFGELDLVAVAAAMAGSTIVDARAVVDRAAADRAGLRLVQIGRP